MNTQKINPITAYNDYCPSSIQHTVLVNELKGLTGQTPEEIADEHTRKQFHKELDKYITSSVVYDAETHHYQSSLSFDVNQFIEYANANKK